MWYKKSSKRKTFKDDLRNTIFIFSMVVLLVISILFYVIMNFIGIHILSTQTDQDNEKISKILHFQIDEYSEFLEDELANEMVKNYFLEPKGEYILYEKLYDFVNSQSIGSIFYIVNSEGMTLITNTFAESPYKGYDIFLTGVYKQMKRYPEQIVMKLNKQQLNSNVRTVYSIGKAILDGDEVIGYILFDLIENDLNQLIQASPVDLTVITDEYRNTIATTNNTVLDNIGKFKPIIIDNKYTDSIRGERHYIRETELFDGIIKVYSLSSHGFISSIYMLGGILIVLTAVGLVIVIRRVSEIFSTKKTESLNRLLMAIEEVQNGNLDVVLSISSNDEFDTIADYFNKMTANLKELMQKNTELLERNNRSEIKQLEAQFNPHFLFNALESLKYLIRLKADDADSFIVSLANLLRYSIDNKEALVTLGTDLEYIEAYLSIQKKRFGSRLEYFIELEDDVENAVIPKLILQPLVENCIHHGYFHKTNLTIKIKGERIGEKLILTIEDDGDGMETQSLEAVNNLLKGDDNDSEHIGIYNVHRRIRLNYGHQYGLKVESVKMQGTIIEIELPL